MAEGDKKQTEQDLPGGVALDHDAPEIQPVLVAPTLEVVQNTIRAYLIPVGCWRIDDVRFDFDSSFVRASAKKEMGFLADLVKQHPGAPLSIFGHADPVGNDDYNKTLSGRRARAIYAMLIRDVAGWEDLYSHPFGGDNWGTKAVQKMLFELGESDVPANGVMDGATQTGLKHFLKTQGKPESGSNNSANRAVIFKAYMDSVCTDAGGKPFQLTKGDFLAKGGGADGKGDLQGCGEFNPVLMFSADEAKDFDQPKNHTQRDVENAPNRRVMALLFRPNTVVDPGRWPCPTVKEGVAGCKKRFWSDADQRRQFQEDRRTFAETKDTYACRFYQRLFELSPCGSALNPQVITVVEIKAKVPGTKGVRNKANQRPESVLQSSTSASDDLKDNPPVVLVRGCNDVELEAVTNPSAPVTWTVTPNHNTNSAPAITVIGGGKRATLKTDKTGSFSVTAATGPSKVVWNVVFVSVNVDVNSAVLILRDDQYADGGSDATDCAFKSGEFKQNEYPWEVTIGKVELVGGGDDGKLGIDQVQLHYMQNGVLDTLTGNYAEGGTASETPKGGMPNVDSNGDPAVSPTGDQNVSPPQKVVSPDQKAALRSFFMGDSPGGGFPRVHPNSKKLLQTISGVNGFRAAVASISVNAKNAWVVHAELSWQADFKGTVAQKGKAIYTTAGHTSETSALKLISPATGGQDAGVAGFETFDPRFNDKGTFTVFKP